MYKYTERSCDAYCRNVHSPNNYLIIVMLTKEDQAFVQCLLAVVESINTWKYVHNSDTNNISIAS